MEISEEEKKSVTSSIKIKFVNTIQLRNRGGGKGGRCYSSRPLTPFYSKVMVRFLCDDIAVIILPGYILMAILCENKNDLKVVVLF
jgi:hypothetical protein